MRIAIYMAEIVQCDVHSPPRGPVVERFVEVGALLLEVLGFRGDGSSGEPAAHRQAHHISHYVRERENCA